MKKIVISLLMLICVVSLQAITFDSTVCYSRKLTADHICSYNNKNRTESFCSGTPMWDYVPGLVAKAMLRTCEQYSDSAEAEDWYKKLNNWGLSVYPWVNDLDGANAGKIYFELYRYNQKHGNTQNAAKCKSNAEQCVAFLKKRCNRIQSPLPGAGGYWHKGSYPNQMWLDGAYMGAAFYAEYLDCFSQDDTAAWNDIALQFDTLFHYTWDADKKLCYHAWCALPSSVDWADPVTGRSKEFWGRGMGWYFAALIDVISVFPKEHEAYFRLISYARMIADGLADRQDEQTGCWYQLLQYQDTTINGCGTNYLESSASAMFTYSYLKGMRLGILSQDYYDIAQKAYKGMVQQFLIREADGSLTVISSCQSAGLGNGRMGDAAYYLCGKDVMINNDTEGKALGPFIMASLEYELQAKPDFEYADYQEPVNTGVETLSICNSIPRKLFEDGRFYIEINNQYYNLLGIRVR